MDVLKLLRASALAYDEPGILAGPAGRDAATVIPLPEGGAILAFRGTVSDHSECSILDWFNDLHFAHAVSRQFPGSVHDGFLQSFVRLWPLVRAALPANGPLWITGHSKGGALAILFGHALAARKPSVVTFAAPKVGNRKFVRDFAADAQVTRYINMHDMVPNLPPFGYWPGPGTCIASPASFASCGDVADNHRLKTGYWPWIAAEASAA